jgi:hypothetical protein
MTAGIAPGVEGGRSQPQPTKRSLMRLTGAEPLVVEAPLILWFGLS